MCCGSLVPRWAGPPLAVVLGGALDFVCAMFEVLVCWIDAVVGEM